MTFNPCWGCLNHCKYCYARRMAKWLAKSTATTEGFYLLRNGLINQDEIKVILDVCNKIERKIKSFEPIFLESKFSKEFPQKIQKIFVGSMSEIRFWKKEWLLKVFKKVEGYPQHIFQFLTKYPYIYHRLEFPAKSWLGFTATTNKDLANGIPHIEKIRTYSLTGKYLYFISIEPVLEEINPLDILFVDWVILGAETGNRKGKIIPKKEWIENIISCCRERNIPIYLKESLKDIYTEEIKEFPKSQLRKEERGNGRRTK